MQTSISINSGYVIRIKTNLYYRPPEIRLTLSLSICWPPVILPHCLCRRFISSWNGCNSLWIFIFGNLVFSYNAWCLVQDQIVRWHCPGILEGEVQTFRFCSELKLWSLDATLQPVSLQVLACKVWRADMVPNFWSVSVFYCRKAHCNSSIPSHLRTKPANWIFCKGFVGKQRQTHSPTLRSSGRIQNSQTRRGSMSGGGFSHAPGCVPEPLWLVASRGENWDVDVML